MFDDIRRTPDGYEVTPKDKQRMLTLLKEVMQRGFYAAVRKAERDAVKIETPQKAAARAYLLERAGHDQLAFHFRRRQEFLRGNGLT